ncbi:MAG: sensor histidine kinase [Oscillospiraceae bacterium]|nr:sensor histidine kinase [Oscillospiraceae bacterium]
MNRIKKSRLLAAALFFAMLFSTIVIILYALNNAVPHIKVEVSDGVADLTGFNFDSSVAYITNMEYYNGRLIVPNELYENVPDGFFDSTAQYNTARVRFVLPNDYNSFMIFGISPAYASRIYVNGSLSETFGIIDQEEPENNVYRVAPFSAVAEPVDGVIELVVQSAGIIRDEIFHYGFYIGSFNVAKYSILCETAYNFIPVVIACMCTLFYLGYFIFAPEVRVNLWFALISLTTGCLLIGNGGFIHSLLPGLDYSAEFYGLYISLLMICALYSLFVRSLYGIPRVVPLIVCILSVVFSIFIFIFPINIVERYLMIHMIFVFTVMIVCTVCILKRIKQFGSEHIISFSGQVIFMMGGVLDMLGSAGVTSFFGLTTFGILFFIFAQMLALYLVNNRAIENERRLALENASLENLNRMKTELLGNISHELKTPLTVVSNVSQLAARHTTDEYIKEKMETAVSEIERMKIKVKQLMELAKAEDAEMGRDFQIIDINSLISKTVSTCFQALDEHNNTLKVELSDKPLLVSADPAHLPGVLVNLIDNAVRFTRNGKIIVSVDYDNDFVTVSVEDTGIGLSPEQKIHIFERFYTGEKSTGTGLGLHICKKVTEAHGGEIQVKSEEGRGTKISFTLPLFKDEEK